MLRAMPPKPTTSSLLRFFTLSTLLAATLFAAENWIEVKSAHFTVYTPASEKEARNIAKQFEEIRALFHSAFPKLRTNPAQSVVIIAVKGEKGMKELLPEQYETKGHTHASGLYQEGFDKHYVILQLDAPGDNPYHALYHEYTHSLTHLNFSNLPLWLDEGLAEYLGNATLGEKRSHIGTVDPTYLYILQSNTLIPIDQLLAIDHDSPYYNESNHASLFYAESWAVVHYLMLNPEARQKQLLQHFLEAWGQSHNQLEAARQTFGDLKKFGELISGYVRGGQFYNTLINNPEEAAEGPLASRPVPAAEVLALRGDFFVHHNRTEAGKPLLEQAVQLDPTLALPHTSLATLYFHLQQPHLAQKEAKEAIRLGDQGFFPLYLLAASRAEMGIASESTRQRVIEELKRCVEINSLFAPAYDLLAQVYASSPEDQKQAITASWLAVRMKPNALEYSARLTELLLTNYRDAEAKIISDQIAKAAYTPAEKEMANELVARVANHKDYPSQIIRGSIPVQPGNGSTPGSSARAQHSDRPPYAQQLLVGLEGTVTSVDCSKNPQIQVTVDGSGGLATYQIVDLAKIEVTAAGDAPAPACTEWNGHKVRLWVSLPVGNKSSAEVKRLDFH